MWCRSHASQRLLRIRATSLAAARDLFNKSAPPPPAPPPVPPRHPDWRHSGKARWLDEYSYLEQGGPEVQRVLRQQRQHAEGWLRRCAPLSRSLHSEMLQLVPRQLVSEPESLGSFEYYLQQSEGRPHPCYMRRSCLGSDQVVLDVNDLAAVHGDKVQVEQLKLSRCGQHVAFTLDVGDGSEAFGAFTRDLRTGTIRHLDILGRVTGLEWADGQALLCTQPNELGRPWRVLGCDTAAVAAGQPAATWKLFEEQDERFFIALGRTKDWTFLTINCNSKTSSEVHLLHANLRGSGTTAENVPLLVQQRTPGLEYCLEHSCGQLYILSNARGATNYSVYRVPTSLLDLGQGHWQRVIGEQEAGGAIEDMDMLSNWLVLYVRRQGRQQVGALPLRHGLPVFEPSASPPMDTVRIAAAEAGDELAAIADAAQAAIADEAGVTAVEVPPVQAPSQVLQVAPLPNWALSVVAGANADYHSDRIRLLLSSPVHPEAAYDWQLGSGQLVERQGSASAEVQQQPLGQQRADIAAATTPSQQHPSSPPGLTWQQLWAFSPDGTQVPITVAHAATLGHPAPRPCLLVVYGAYGHCLPTDYMAERIPLLRRGWVLALAHVRGGGELGRQWHAAGQGAAKASSVDDLGGCLDFLILAGYTAPGMVALQAHSAGGLVAGALLNRRPEDFGAALLEAPFVDVVSAMCQPDLPLTAHEYEEFGDPAIHFEQMRAVCPYQTVRQVAYPPVLLTCSQQDMRVPFWGPLKYGIRLQAAVAQQTPGDRHSRQSGPILVLPDAQAGHFVHDRDFDTKAQQYSFLITAIEGQL